MDMLMGDKIADADLADWRKLAQGLHARYLIGDFGSGARFISSVGEAGDEVDHYPMVSMGAGYVDLKLITDDAIYRADDGTEHIVAWPTQQDVDLARRITEIAADQHLVADPAAVSQIELGLDTATLRDDRTGVGRSAHREPGRPGPWIPQRRDPRRHRPDP